MTAAKHHFIVQPRNAVFADDEDAERRRLEAVLKTAPKKHKVIRGRCREMLKAEWVSLAELWYRQTSEHNQAMFRKVFREIHAVTEAQVETLRSAASLAFDRARSFRLAKVMLKLYFSVILRPEYYKKALYWGYAHGQAGELLARTVFGGIESLTSLKFSHYTQTFGKPDDAVDLGRAATVVSSAASSAAPQRLSNAWDPDALRYKDISPGKRQMEPLDGQRAVAFAPAGSSIVASHVSSGAMRRKVRSARLPKEMTHWKPADADAQGKGLRGPSWIVAGVGKNWTTTNRDHFCPKPLPHSLAPCADDDPSVSFGATSLEMTITKGFVAPAVTASSGGCLPRATLPPRAASAPLSSPTPTPGDSALRR
eukprot:TRINITY_DN3732_c0_g1_i1.p1 TRINITY_DN3732_c0_g1~~TRINITY_DN3732_c0_g1_i1.p1  ORF type:complete len:368 (+),score=94.58 TRINITY_DN3732_c0_g1_i1:98-1201(+)